MADAAFQRMSADEFLAWAEGREGRWELVDGVPRRDIEMMAGTTDRHDQIVVNLIAALGPRLRGGELASGTSALGIKTARGLRVRRADVVVDGGPRRAEALHVRNPKAAFEVLCDVGSGIRSLLKIEEYKALKTMCHVVVLEPRAPLLVGYSRAANDAWTAQEIEGIEAVLPLPSIGAELPLAEIYPDVTFGG